MTTIAAFLLFAFLGYYCVAAVRWRKTFSFYLTKNTAAAQQQIEPAAEGVTLVVAMHNEEKNAAKFAASLRTNLPHLPAVLVLDHCTDNTAAILRQSLHNYTNVTIIENTAPQGKKHAQRLGVQAAQTPWVALTDADCHFSARWISALLRSAQQNRASLILAPVSMIGNGSLLTHLFELEFLSLQVVSAATALNHHATMCNGANMLALRAFYLSHNQHTQYASGDDMFLLSEAKRQGQRISYCLCPEALVITPTPQNLRQFLRQRMRWLRKATGYTDPDVRRLGYLVFAANIVWPTLLLLVPCGLSPLFAAAAFALKTLFDTRLLRTAATFFHLRADISTLLLLALLYPTMMLVVATLSIFKSKKKW